MQHGYDWSGANIDGWLASEKFDGCRAYWDGVQLWTRGGNVVNAPRWFTEALPVGVNLDGELWAGRGNFTEARLAAQYGSRHFMRTIKFCAFDAPLASGAWPERMASIVGNEVVAPVEFQTVQNELHLLALFTVIKAAGGEGLIIRVPSLPYSSGRTPQLLKVKHAEQFSSSQMRRAA